MSQAARNAYVATYQAPAQTYFYAAVNKGSGPLPSLPVPFDFNATAKVALEYVDYPSRKVLRLRATHTEQGQSKFFEMIFSTRPTLGIHDLEAENDDLAITYYSDPVNGVSHRATSGYLVIKKFDDESIEGSFDGVFGSGGADGNAFFPIDGRFFGESDSSTRG
ncbi:hypothetical protein [Pseudomonas frederiksbergensis]|uniref:hypothetical protein n=1 Tax=Pseudomonas frederiksbergensis TaxID=104087 RepID=UPI003D21DCBB